MKKTGAPSVVCLGFFDGVHKGHLALVHAGRQAADAQGLILVVHTFDHAPGSKGPELTTLAEREQLLLAAGADEVRVSPFDDRMRCMTGDAFFRQVVLGEMNARHVVCGDDHRFGYRGAFGVKELAQLCGASGVKLTVVPPVELPGGMRISSSAIRKALAAGDDALAQAMLGRFIPEAMKQRLTQTR